VALREGGLVEEDMAIKIDNSQISDRDWEDVDKTELANKLEDSGDEEAIREAFAYVPDLEDHSKWGGPHHELRGDTLIVNRKGVHALAVVLSGGRGGVNWPKTAREAAARHVRKHYRELGEEAPEMKEAA
jgi:hypothetical protein